MSSEKEKKLPGISRQAEEMYLTKTLAVVRDNVENYGRDVAKMKEDIDEMLEHFHDDNPEVINLLENTITLHDHMKRALERNEKAQNKPYFGRIIFHDETLNKQESLYIGRGGISKDTTHWMVVDWRAPVANAYYENGIGKCSYPSPGGGQIDIDLQLKRTYEIENGKLLDYFDSEVIANDDLLTKYLAKNKQAVLGEIVATIQKEQNEIIRKSPYHNIIVQGVAGSGKTTVAMHRISFILYNYAERFKPDDFYIVGSNRILLNYITGVLPDLDVYGIRQMTMEQLFVRLLYEDWDESKYRIRSTDKTGRRGIAKGGLSWFRDLEKFCARLEWETILRESIYLNPKQFVEGYRDGKAGVFDETVGKPVNPQDLVRLVDGDAVERYILQNPTVSVQSKIDMLNERLTIKIKEEFLAKGVKYSEAERKAILKAYRNRYGGKVWKRSIFDIYEEFLKKQIAAGHDVDIPGREFDVYDLAALAYIYKRIKETEVISEAHHVVIDEAQDFGMMAYNVLKFCIKDCTYTIMGDVSQNIHFGYGLSDWEELKELYLADEMASFGILKKSYRNTVEISNFATDILHHGQFSSYPVEPIIRHGEPVTVRQVSDRSELIDRAAEVCREWQKKGLDTIAVVCRDQESAAEAADRLSKFVDVMESDLEKAEFGNGIMVLPVEYTKGLEFDAVLILDPSREEYPVEDGHAKLLYVAATRALHELCVLHTGDLTGLIAYPVPKRKAKEVTGGSGRAAVRPAAADKSGRPGKKNISIVRNESAAGSDGVESPGPQRGSGMGVPAGAEKAAVAEFLQSENPQQRRTNRPRPVAAAAQPQRSALLDRYTIALQSTGAPGAGRVELAAPTPSGRNVKADFAGDSQQRQAARAQARLARATAGVNFGDMPDTDRLRPAGHAKIDMAVRWVTKHPDGLYLQSRYGLLRISPINSAIVRVTFTRNGQIADVVNPKIAVNRADRAWKYKDSSRMVELVTNELWLQVDKTTGAIRYLNRDKQLLVSERSRECRQLEIAADGSCRSWLYLDWQRGENLYGFSTGKKGGMLLRGTARYISHGESGEDLPFIFSDKGYGIVLACEGEAICCDIPSYGSYLYGEKAVQQDYYFIVGKQPNAILNGYGYLTGKM